MNRFVRIAEFLLAFIAIEQFTVFLLSEFNHPRFYGEATVAMFFLILGIIFLPVQIVHLFHRAFIRRGDAASTKGDHAN